MTADCTWPQPARRPRRALSQRQRGPSRPTMERDRGRSRPVRRPAAGQRLWLRVPRPWLIGPQDDDGCAFRRATK